MGGMGRPAVGRLTARVVLASCDGRQKRTLLYCVPACDTLVRRPGSDTVVRKNPGRHSMPKLRAEQGDQLDAAVWVRALAQKVSFDVRKGENYYSRYVAREEIARHLRLPLPTLSAWMRSRGGPTLAQAIAWSKRWDLPLPGAKPQPQDKPGQQAPP